MHFKLPLEQIMCYIYIYHSTPHHPFIYNNFYQTLFFKHKFNNIIVYTFREYVAMDWWNIGESSSTQFDDQSFIRDNVDEFSDDDYIQGILDNKEDVVHPFMQFTQHVLIELVELMHFQSKEEILFAIK